MDEESKNEVIELFRLLAIGKENYEKSIRANGTSLEPIEKMEFYGKKILKNNKKKAKGDL